MAVSAELADLEVTDRASFIQYLKLFKEDVLRNKGSENQDLVKFLEVMASWSEALPDYYADVQPEDKINVEIPTWSQFADMMMGARILE